MCHYLNCSNFAWSSDCYPSNYRLATQQLSCILGMVETWWSWSPPLEEGRVPSPRGHRHWIVGICCTTPHCRCKKVFLCQEAWLGPTCETLVYIQSKVTKSISIYPFWSTWHECVKMSTSKLSWTIGLCSLASKSRNPIGLGAFMEGSTNRPK